MLITQVANLVPGKEYWHLYIQDKCNWAISKKADIYYVIIVR